VTTVILVNKPYGVLPQFTDGEQRQTLSAFVPLRGVYPAGRLDRDSEGLMILTDDGQLQHLISHPRHKLAKTYWVQVEGGVSEQALASLRRGVLLNDGMTAPAEARLIEEPVLWTRTPPIRYRANIPTSWIELVIHEGRNRQVRRMTAAVGHPTLRLVRWRIGPWCVAGLAPGEWRALAPAEYETILPRTPRQDRGRQHRPVQQGTSHERLEAPRDRRRRPRTGGTFPPGGGRGRG